MIQRECLLGLIRTPIRLFFDLRLTRSIPTAAPFFFSDFPRRLRFLCVKNPVSVHALQTSS